MCTVMQTSPPLFFSQFLHRCGSGGPGFPRLSESAQASMPNRVITDLYYCKHFSVVHVEDRLRIFKIFHKMADDTSMPQTIKTVGIYHGLPAFPQSHEPLSALVVGASGISGQHMIHVLSQSPERWTKIYALSRSPRKIPTAMASLVTHVPADLLKPPEEIARKLIDSYVKASGSTPK